MLLSLMLTRMGSWRMLGYPFSSAKATADKPGPNASAALHPSTFQLFVNVEHLAENLSPGIAGCNLLARLVSDCFQVD